jgi:hypothetical protein
MRRYNTTTFLGNGEYLTPLPIRPLSSGDVSEASPFVGCVTSSVRACARDFEGPGFRLCLYGMLTASSLLPAGVAALSREDNIDPSGAFAAGLSMYCPLG